MTNLSSYSLSFDFAEPLRRLGAFLIDTLVIMVGLYGLAVLMDVRESLQETDTPYYYAFQVLIPWFYYATMDSVVKQGTLGKMALKIKVIDLEGRPLSFGRSAIRAIPKIFPPLWLGFMLVVITARRQALHDLIARTLVVKVPDV